MKSRLLIPVSILIIIPLCAISSFGYTGSYTGTKTITPDSPNPPTSEPNVTSPANEAGSWQQSASEAIRAAETATEKAYTQLAQNVKDVSLQARIMAVLHENKDTRNSDVQISAENGVVTLTGQVPSAQNAQRVQGVVTSVYGVKAVSNRLTYPGERRAATPPDADSTGVAHPAYSDIAPAEKAPAH